MVTTMRLTLFAAASICLAQNPIQLKSVKSQPFSAQAVTQITQNLADGNHIVHTSTAQVARDSDGRTRRADSSSVLLQDPVVGLTYLLDQNARTARRLSVPQSQAADSQAPSQSDAKSESLGSQVIEGVQAEGTRLTRTIPAGQSGNERAIVVTIETWYSPDLQTVLISRTIDPRVGETVYKLTNIERTEPPRQLFEVPREYLLRDERTGQSDK
jgi:hypothetical protein